MSSKRTSTSHKGGQGRGAVAPISYRNATALTSDIANLQNTTGPVAGVGVDADQEAYVKAWKRLGYPLPSQKEWEGAYEEVQNCPVVRHPTNAKKLSHQNDLLNYLNTHYPVKVSGVENCEWTRDMILLLKNSILLRKYWAWISSAHGCYNRKQHSSGKKTGDPKLDAITKEISSISATIQKISLRRKQELQGPQERLAVLTAARDELRSKGKLRASINVQEEVDDSSKEELSPINMSQIATTNTMPNVLTFTPSQLIAYASDPLRFPEVQDFVNQNTKAELDDDNDEGDESADEEAYSTVEEENERRDDDDDETSSSSSDRRQPSMLGGFITNAMRSLTPQGYKRSELKSVKDPVVQPGSFAFESPLIGQPNPFKITPTRGSDPQKIIKSIGKSNVKSPASSKKK